MACQPGRQGDGLAVLSDVRDRPARRRRRGGRRRRAAALLFGDGPGVLAETIGGGTATGEFTRPLAHAGRALLPASGRSASGEHAYGPLADEAIAVALRSRPASPVEDLDHVIVTGLPGRAVTACGGALGARPEALADDLTDESSATPAPPTGRCCSTDVLDRAEPGQMIAVVQLADGCDVWLLRTTEAIAGCAPALTVRRAARRHATTT